MKPIDHSHKDCLNCEGNGWNLVSYDGHRADYDPCPGYRPKAAPLPTKKPKKKKKIP